MRKNYTAITICFLLLLFAFRSSGQQRLVSDAKKKELNDLSVQLNTTYAGSHQRALGLAKAHGWVIRRVTKSGGIVSLQGVNSLGFPVYLITHNLTSAQTTNTTAVQPGGSLGLTLSGSSSFMDGKLAIWDGGSVYTQHQEFAGKTITIKDPTAQVIDHATHVAGTMIAKGVVPDAKGMAFGANTLISYEFDNDVTDMSAEAPNLLISNHSYGDEAGWNFNDNENRWEWYGLPGDTVDASFGIYDSRTRAFDQIAYSAPYYLIVESAGNSHAYAGPPVGGDYYGYNSRTDQTLVDKGPRPAGISSNLGYSVIATTGNAKNIMTVGAVSALTNGPSNSQDIKVAYFSSYGPTGDGRVKPDIVGMGVNVLSTGSDGPSEYLTESGTSMSSPNVAGSLYLLQEYYAELNPGVFMHAATLKGLACATAFDAGNAGPDYIYGWGLLNMKRAAQALTDNGTKSLVKEYTLLQGQKQSIKVIASGTEPLMATISWTDPAAAPTNDGTLNDNTIKLVNDLDIRVSDGTSTYMPWVLNPANPSASATTGDNIRDNIEQVYIASPVAGETYTITVSNKGSLQSGSQAYGAIITGISGINKETANNADDIGLNVFPIPASNKMNVAFTINSARPLTLSLVNAAGKTVYADKRSLSAGSFSLNIDVSSQPSGIYTVKMLLAEKVYARKIIIVK